MVILYLLIWFCLYKIIHWIIENKKELFTYPYQLQVQHTIYILVPCYNFEQYIKKCLLSIYKQTYKNYKCIIINDGSTDLTRSIINLFCKMDSRFQQFNYKKNRGPAFGKYIGFLQIKKRCTPNDICVVLDGDDYFFRNDSLSIINNTYNKTKCWFTYGTDVGEHSRQCLNIVPLNITNYRKHTWHYNHPRTFKTYILNYFTKKDFLYRNNSWLKKGTDINYVFKCLEFSGNEKIKHIDTIIYYYRSHPRNTQHTMSTQTWKDHKNYAISNKPINKYNESIHIIVYSINNLENILNQIKNQTVLSRIKLHIINKPNQSELITKYHDINITEYKSSNKNESVVIFNYIKMILRHEFMDYIILLNNDCEFNSTYIEELYKQKQPQSISGWNGGFFNNKTDPKIDFDFNKLTTEDIKQNNKKDITTYDYVDSNLAIIDASIFTLQIIEPIPDINNIGIWLSCYCSKLNWKMHRTFLIPNKINNLDISSNENKLKYIKSCIKKQYWPRPHTIITSKI